MAFNIAVKSKYNPFKYEDYVKPLDEYAKSYEKYEDLITAEEVKLSALEPYTDLFSQNNDDQQGNIADPVCHFFKVFVNFIGHRKSSL